MISPIFCHHNYLINNGFIFYAIYDGFHSPPSSKSLLANFVANIHI